VVEITINTLEFDKRRLQMVTIRDFSEVLNGQKRQLTHDYEQKMISTLAHEQITPLNSIVNISAMLVSHLHIRKLLTLQKLKRLGKFP